MLSVGLAALIVGYLYTKVPKSTITVYSDGSIDATLGNQIITDKNWVVNGILELKTWNGYLLQIFIPVILVGESLHQHLVNGKNIDYQLSKSGKILSSGTEITDNKNDDFITITFA